LISVTLQFPSTWAALDWRYFTHRRGPVAWWEHLDAISAPIISVGVGSDTLGSQHIQPSIATTLLQYHMTHGTGDDQQDDDIALSQIDQLDFDTGTGAVATPILGQLAFTHTIASLIFIQGWVQGGYDPISNTWSGSAGITFGGEVGVGSSRHRDDRRSR
jgi:hypothetical protein